MHNLARYAELPCARADDERRALAAGYQMHIPKPVEPDLLAAAVARLAGGDSEN
jgi:CheY-like chemotaxis protein